MSESQYYVPAQGNLQVECRSCQHWLTELPSVPLGGNGVCVSIGKPDSGASVLLSNPNVDVSWAFVAHPTFFCADFLPREAAKALITDPKGN